MTTPRVKIPERLKGERGKAYNAFCDYCQMGVGRSLRKLHENYVVRLRDKGGTDLPTKHTTTLGRWSSRYAWQERAAEYDLAMCEVSQAGIEKEALTGVARPANRIQRLKKIFEDLSHMIYEENEDFEINHPGRRPFLWLKEVKIIGSGVAAREITTYRYNTAIVGDFRGLLDDLSKETGGRRAQLDVTSAGQGITLVAAREELKNLSVEELGAHYRNITQQ